MSFRLPPGSKEWFAQLRNERHGVKLDFDIYYFCVSVGLVARRRVPNDTPDPFVTYWINKYESVSRLLISQLIVAEVEKNGISLTDKKEVQKESERLLQNADNTKLSKEGMRLMNAYAAGGFHEIRSQFATKPYTMHVFLRKYVEVVNQIVSDRNTGD